MTHLIIDLKLKFNSKFRSEIVSTPFCLLILSVVSTKIVSILAAVTRGSTRSLILEIRSEMPPRLNIEYHHDAVQSKYMSIQESVKRALQEEEREL